MKSIAGAAVLLLGLGGVVDAQVEITGVTLDNAKLKNGVVTAPGGTVTGTLLGLPFTTDIKHFELDLTPALEQTGCPILNLELAPIHLQLLGLHVDTSRICLAITANDEGLLGPLLCNLVGPGGINLGDILNGLLGGGDGGLLGDILEGILNDLLGQTPGNGGGGGNNGNGNNGNGRVCRGQCEVLHLVLGPVDLNIPLLGLEVMLDNCNGGPVEVCVSATAREGLLGQLLCGLVDGGLLNGITLGNITEFIEALPANLTPQQLGALRTLLLGILG